MSAKPFWPSWRLLMTFFSTRITSSLLIDSAMEGTFREAKVVGESGEVWNGWGRVRRRVGHSPLPTAGGRNGENPAPLPTDIAKLRSAGLCCGRSGEY